MTIEFLITSIVVILIPGTGVVYTIATGLGAGRAASIAAAFGCTLGILPHLTATVFGLAAVLHTSALLFQVVKFCGVAYLLYLAYQTLRESGPISIARSPSEDKSRHQIGKMKIITTGALINVLNPKLSIFFLAFLPQFVTPSSATLITGAWITETLALGGYFMAMTFAIFVVYGLFAAFIGNIALRSDRFMRWFRRTTAIAFASFGLRLALSDNP